MNKLLKIIRLILMIFISFILISIGIYILNHQSMESIIPIILIIIYSIATLLFIYIIFKQKALHKLIKENHKSMQELRDILND